MQLLNRYPVYKSLRTKLKQSFIHCDLTMFKEVVSITAALIALFPIANGNPVSPGSLSAMDVSAYICC